jgi:hypothetical protein
MEIKWSFSGKEISVCIPDKVVEENFSVQEGGSSTRFQRMQNYHFHNTCSLPNNIGLIKSRKIRRAQLGEVKNERKNCFRNHGKAGVNRTANFYSQSSVTQE